MNRVIKKNKDSYRHGDLKSALVAQALKTIKKSNRVDFSLRELALQVGVTHTAAYRHFKSKEEILYTVAEEGFARLNESFIEILRRDASDILSLGVAYVQFAVANPEHFKVMFHPDLKIDGQHPRLVNFGAQTFLYLNECVRLNIEKGLFSDRTVDELSLAAWSTVHGLAVLAVNGNLVPLPNGHKLSVDEAPALVAQVLIEGLKKR